MRDKLVQHDQDLSDSEDEGSGGRRNHETHKARLKRPSIMEGGRHPTTEADQDEALLNNSLGMTVQTTADKDVQLPLPPPTTNDQPANASGNGGEKGDVMDVDKPTVKAEAGSPPSAVP